MVFSSLMSTPESVSPTVLRNQETEMNSLLNRLHVILCLVALTGAVLGVGASSAAAQSYVVAPASGLVTWPTIAVGMPSNGNTVSVTNTGTSSLTITSFSITPSDFRLIDGYAPTTLPPNASIAYQINFVPSVAQVINGNITITIQGVTNPVVVNLTGSGKKTLAVGEVLPTTMTFNQPVGTTSAPMTVSVSNTGKSNMTLNAVTIDPPFTITGVTLPKVMPVGTTLTFPVSFYAQSTRTYRSTLFFTFDNVPAKGVSMTGTGTPPSALTVASYPTLPTASTNAAYLTTLQSAGGTGAVTWSLATGSTLPAGLILSSTGTISGTLNSSVTVGNHTFTAKATDSTSATATAPITLPVATNPGSNCNSISINVPGTSTPIVPLNDLGTGTYQGYEGGFYANGSNVRPAQNEADGLAFANAITPLDASGNPDPVNGKIGFITIGMSAAHTDSDGFIDAAAADPTRNPKLVFVNAAMNGVLGVRYADPHDSVWSADLTYMVPQAGLTPQQIQVAWVSESDAIISGTFPTDMGKLKGQLQGIAQNIHTYFPNVKLAYYSPRYYTGYSNGIAKPANDEPYAYESGFAVKNAIQDQINGLPALNYNSANGPVKAPWMSWGPYYWANGLIARSDGLVLTCQDAKADGNHPSIPQGKQKDALQILNFFKTDETATPWFLAH
jgi:Putative Ig domain